MTEYVEKVAITFHLIRVPYAIEEAIRDAAELQMPDFDAYALELRTGRYRGEA